jgi:hypothetical protein
MTGKERRGGYDASAEQSSLSARVQLEIAVLASDTAADLPSELNVAGSRKRTVLVAAGEMDVRRYVRECLHTRTDLQLLEAGSIAATLEIAVQQPPHLFIVDEPQAAAVLDFPSVPVILIADETPDGLMHRRPPPAAALVLLARPFQARGLLEQVNALLNNETRAEDGGRAQDPDT